MRWIGIVMAALVAIVVGGMLASPAPADDPMGPCIRSCNEECNLLLPGIPGGRKECKPLCFAGRCGHPGALSQAADGGEPGHTCELDSVCNEYCGAETYYGVEDPDCDAPVACPCDFDAIPMNVDVWQCLPEGPPPVLYCTSFTTDLRQALITTVPLPEPLCLPINDPFRTPMISADASMPPCGGPKCNVRDTHRGADQWECLTADQAQACAEKVIAYAIALDDVQGVDVYFSTDPASCPDLAP
jgi:hypothetical protein